MPIRDITLDVLKAWLPATFAADTTWTDQDLQSALDGGHHPRLIAAEVWEEYAATLDDPKAPEKPVESWQNGEISMTYAEAHTARAYALKQARHHRARGPIRSVPLANSNPAYEEG